MLNGDEGIRELLRDFKGLSVIPLYFEEKQGPLLVVDTQGNIISTDEQIPRLSFHDDFEPFHNEFDAPILDEAINSPEFDISTSEPANNTNSIHTPPSISENNPDSIHFDGVETSISEEGEGEQVVDEGEGEQVVDEGEGDQGVDEGEGDQGVPPQPAQRPETTQPPSNNNPQAPSQMQGTLQPSQRPMQHAPRRRKQSAPVSKSAKMQKMAEGTGISFQRECCSSTRPTLSSQLKRLSSSYRPSTGSSSSKGQDASGKKN
ncbi:hypothetical protein Salat_1496400 [Sesamum alatum]|uniref:Uncharacterized protein n=1 Tax=Sesamum alatum TaxID=300844 RepID=A0AAE1YBX0_9LAMI|nr:hypothetical protein Salat_1496400 [Sesamum alatum]